MHSSPGLNAILKQIFGNELTHVKYVSVSVLASPVELYKRAAANEPQGLCIVKDARRQNAATSVFRRKTAAQPRVNYSAESTNK
jgi:hypothetical protein